MRLSKRAADVAVAATIILLALAISPIGIRFVSGRLDLPLRVNVVSLTFAAILLILAVTIVSRGRARQILFHVLAWSFVLAAIAAVEVGAQAIGLSDRIAPLEGTSTLLHGGRWPPQLMSSGRLVEQQGLRLYRPWRGDGILINDLGLRTAPPTPKRPGEWRIAVTGGSAAWGWRVLDVDTIAVRLQETLHRQGHPNVVVYNFGIEIAAIAQELALLRRFHDLYAIDQTVFYTGGNDATLHYLGATAPQGSRLLAGPHALELIKVTHRLSAKFLAPDRALLARMDDEILPRLARTKALRDGIAAASAYCRAATMRCDFMLQPMLLTRRTPIGPEVAIAQTLKQLHPRYDAVTATIFRSAQELGPTVHDLSGLFDGSAGPVFIDAIHTSEAGYRLAAERIAAIIAPGLQ
jgi:lysophospholipase L1-like esterase